MKKFILFLLAIFLSLAALFLTKQFDFDLIFNNKKNKIKKSNTESTNESTTESTTESSTESTN